MRLWGGRFSEENDQRVADFTRSIEVDAGLAADDLDGLDRPRPRSRPGRPPHRDEVDELVGGLTGLAEDVAAGRSTGTRPSRTST